VRSRSLTRMVFALTALLVLVPLLKTSPLFAAADANLTEYFSSTALSGTATAIDLGKPYPVVQIINDDSSITIYVRGDGGVATTSSPRVLPGEKYILPKPANDAYSGRQNISIIAASGTPSCRIYGLP